MKSMGKMKSLGPEIENLKTRFKDDKQQLQREMMKLYKVNGVNPASSCFPILIQIPIFFSLYKLLLLDLAMRHSPFVWVWQDLSAKDPLTIFNLFGLLPFSVPTFLEIGLLPVLMGSSMWLQMKLSPQPSGSDEMQKMQKKSPHKPPSNSCHSPLRASTDAPPRTAPPTPYPVSDRVRALGSAL